MLWFAVRPTVSLLLHPIKYEAFWAPLLLFQEKSTSRMFLMLMFSLLSLITPPLLHAKPFSLLLPVAASLATSPLPSCTMFSVRFALLGTGVKDDWRILLLWLATSPSVCLFDTWMVFTLITRNACVADSYAGVVSTVHTTPSQHVNTCKHTYILCDFTVPHLSIMIFIRCIGASDAMHTSKRRGLFTAFAMRLSVTVSVKGSSSRLPKLQPL